MNILTNRQSHRQTDRQMGRQTSRNYQKNTISRFLLLSLSLCCSVLTTTNMKATAMMVRIRMPTHIIAERQPGFSSVGLRLPSNAALCPCGANPCELGGGTRIVTALVASRIKRVHTSPSLCPTQHFFLGMKHEISSLILSYKYRSSFPQYGIDSRRSLGRLYYFCMMAVIGRF